LIELQQPLPFTVLKQKYGMLFIAVISL